MTTTKFVRTKSRNEYLFPEECWKEGYQFEGIQSGPFVFENKSVRIHDTDAVKEITETK